MSLISPQQTASRPPQTAVAGPPPRRKSTVWGTSRRRRLRVFAPVFLLMAPAMVYLAVNNYVPMAGIVVAFKKFNVQEGIWGSPWVGLDNFVFLFGSGDASIILRNTLLYNLAFIVVTNVVAIALAVMIHDVVSEKLKKLYQGSVLLPFMLSIVVVSYIVFAFLSQENGLLNNTFFADDPVEWYGEGEHWPSILILVNLWRTVGFSTLLFLAALTAIDGALYESAQLDGANRWDQFRHVTLPNLMPTIITLVLLGVGRIFYSDFGLFYQVPMDSGAIYDATQTIDTYVYRALTSVGGIGRSAAAGFFQSMVGFVLVLGVNWAVRRYNAKSAIF
ncbi:ABC transporter permease [Demequina muriae]|uniref:ABC transporter permease subunit n=1 Tax=Demequina muriae TaxID=3051664 RepID=A0ABT8GGK9_9MICO|nr:ABC transporter permease subunit [Demequina sp. EGI L300058]MDN4480563.1 ABC transporter permease subunit [Demequina sp. EGI L300058]